MRIGILSDTHGLLRPEVLTALMEANVQHILHAGDVGDASILARLAEIAPITAIRGNIDTQGPCAELPATEAIELAGHMIYLVHSVQDLDIDPAAAGLAMVVSGHSHQPSMLRRGQTLFLNPGSCGPRRFRLPVTLALADLSPAGIDAHLVDLLATSAQ